MMHILVVEDEYWIRQGILKAIRWNELDMKSAGEARNGLEALDLLAQTPIDIIVMDMKMPCMNGEELLRRLAELNYHGGLIVLSEYSTYSYMRQAIRSQVDEYMLKPIDENELNQVLMRIRERLLKEQSQDEPASKLLEALLTDKANTPSIDTACTLALLWAQNLNRIPFTHTALDGYTLYWRQNGLHEALLACCGAETALPLRLEAVCSAWAQTNGGDVVCSLSNPIQPGNERTAMQQARFAAGYLHKNQHVISYQELQHYDHSNSISLANLPSIRKLLQTISMDQAASIASQLLKPFQNEHYINLSVLQGSILELNVLLDQACREYTMNISVFTEHAEAISLLHSVSSAESYIKELLVDCLSVIMPFRTAKSGDVVEQITTYLQAHYADEINLLSLSEQYHMNYIYLSRLFKKKTGQNFTEYLLAIRMNEAKKLLLQGTLHVKDVAELVGYSNPYYFTTSYQKFFHHCPSDDA